MERERKKGDGGAVDGAEAAGAPANQLRDAKMRQRQRQRKGEPELVEPKDDEMSMVAVEESDIQTVRDRMTARIDKAQTMGWLALDRFQDILRSRDAAPVLEKGFAELAQKNATDWFTGHVKEGIKGVVEAIEIPLAPVEKTVDLAREGLGGITESSQAEAKLEAVSAIVNQTRHAFISATEKAKAAIASAQPMALFRADAAIDDQRPIISSSDVDELTTKLLATLTEQLGKSGTLTANEFLDRARHDRQNIGSETEAVKKRQTE